MKKKLILTIIIILVVVFALCFFVLSDSTLIPNNGLNNKKVSQCGFIDSKGNINVGNISYSLPEGYKQGETNNFGHISITNGSNEIFFGVYYDKTIDDLTEEYMNYTTSHNQTATKSKFTQNSLDITRYVNDQVGANHYWFKHNGKIYTIYTWVKTPNDDEVITKLIDSIK